MPERFDSFESLEDFGFTRQVTSAGTKYVQCESISAYQDPSLIQGGEGDGTPGRFYTLTDILSGGSNTVPVEVTTGNTAELALDYTDTKSLAFLGSVYSVIADSINKIKDTYPNGFLIYSAYTGSSSIIFNNNETYWYGGGAGSIIDYTDFKLVEISGSTALTSYAITDWTTGATSSYLILDGQPTGGTGLTYVVSPNQNRLDRYYATLNRYELDLLVPPTNRSNYWPKDLIVSGILTVEGSRYTTFLEVELAVGLSADTNTANYLWRNLFPDGLKNLDSDDQVAQKFIYTMAACFDFIKRHQDHLRYSHTIDYYDYNHISKDLVHLLSEHWDWPLAHDLKQDDYSQYLYPTYDNYVTGITYRLSRKDINFERWRRVLTNIVHLYKKKGTREGVKYFTNIYGIPEALLTINEYLRRLNADGKFELFISEANIVVPTGYTKQYVTSDGYYSSYTNTIIQNTKFLDLVISPSDAIEFDAWNWGTDNHPTIRDVNGRVLTLTGITRRSEYEQKQLDYLIPSDGTARYAANYPLLEKQSGIYLTGSTNKFTYTNLMPFVDFLDDSWAVMATKLLPASSKILAAGTLWRNTMWHRQKHQWNDAELDNKALPLNQTISLPQPAPVMSKVATPDMSVATQRLDASRSPEKSAEVDYQSLSASKAANPQSTIDHIVIESSKPAQQTVTIPSFSYGGTHNPWTGDIYTLAYVESGSTISVNSPIVTPISGQYGTSNYTAFTSSAVSYTNDYTLDITVSAHNLSNSGYTRLSFELFKEVSEEDIQEAAEIEYSIISVINETDQFGRYRVSSVSGLQKNQLIRVLSPFVPALNDTVTISEVYQDEGEIKTQPKIGLFDLPVGENGSQVSWIDIYRDGVVDDLRSIINVGGITAPQLLHIITWMKDNLPYVEDRTQDDTQAFVAFLQEYCASIGVNYITVLSRIAHTINYYPLEYLYASILILQFVIASPTWSFEDRAIFLINAVVQQQTRAKFVRYPYLFDWANPIQQLTYDSDTPGEFQFPIMVSDLDNREGNEYSVTGIVQLGGFTDLNAQILEDKTEYFWTYKAETHVPTGWTIDDDSLITISGVDIINQDTNLQMFNSVPYYGNYFMYMKSPKIPNLDTFPVNSAGTYLETASVLLKWKGVSDSDRMVVQFLPDPTGSPITTGVTTPVWTTYDDIPSTAWTASATSIDIAARLNVNDDHLYSLQTTLTPLTYYWWRIRNVRSKVTIFGYNAEAISSTEPYLFATGDFVAQDVDEGENPDEPTPPERPGGNDNLGIP